MGRQIDMNKEKKQSIETGKLATNRKGFGFINFEESDRRVVFEPGNLSTALSGDTVEYKILKKNADGEFGAVTKVVERGKENYVGIVLEDKGQFFLIPDDKRAYLDFIIIASERSKTWTKLEKRIKKFTPSFFLGQIQNKIHRLK